MLKHLCMGSCLLFSFEFQVIDVTFNMKSLVHRWKRISFFYNKKYQEWELGYENIDWFLFWLTWWGTTAAPCICVCFKSSSITERRKVLLFCDVKWFKYKSLLFLFLILDCAILTQSISQKGKRGILFY